MSDGETRPVGPPPSGTEPPPAPLHLHRWLAAPVIGASLIALAAGFGQFGAVATLGDVARAFGREGPGASIADQAGLSGTALGVGLAVLRLASLAGLPLAGLADRYGRRPTLLVTCGLGLALTVTAAASPGYWWFIAIFALGRPLLSAAAAVAEVNAAEQTAASDRAKAVALVAAAYGVGAGLTAIIHGFAGTWLGFRGVFALAIVPLALLPLVGRRVGEPDRFTRAALAGEHPVPVLGPLEHAFRGRLLIVATLAFAVSVVTGPANSFVFVYAQNVLGLSSAVTGAMVTAAGVFGLAGLLGGRWLADRFGRRPTAAFAMAAMALCGMLTYSGSRPALVAGYLLGILSASTFAPAAGSLTNELFPTSVRASVAGWHVAAGVLGAVAGLVAFGAVADAGDRFPVAALVTFAPVVVATALFWSLPETRGREPEDLWPA